MKGFTSVITQAEVEKNMKSGTVRCCDDCKTELARYIHYETQFVPKGVVIAFFCPNCHYHRVDDIFFARHASRDPVVRDIGFIKSKEVFQRDMESQWSKVVLFTPASFLKAEN